MGRPLKVFWSLGGRVCIILGMNGGNRMRKKGLLVGMVWLLTALSSCDFLSSLTFPIFTDKSESVSQSESPSSQTEPESSSDSNPQSVESVSQSGSEASGSDTALASQKTFSHAFSFQDFQAEGGMTQAINGLVFSYSPFSYLAQHGQGIQIGSASKPQSDPWTLKASLPDGVRVVGYSFQASNAKDGVASYNVHFGTYSKDGEFSSDTVGTFGEDNIDEPSDNFSLTFQATKKAIYFYSLSIVLEKDGGIEEDIHEDIETYSPVVPGTNGIPDTAFDPISVKDYYAGIDLTEEKDKLKKDLRAKVADETTKRYRYGDAQTLLLYTDESLDKPGYDYGMWDGDSIKAEWTQGQTWQREHVWAASHLGLPSGEDGHDNTYVGQASDLHNLRVASPESNLFHSNRYFGETNIPESDGKEGYFFPNITEKDQIGGIHSYTGDFRGDAARICFYMAIRYDVLKLTDDPDNDPANSMGLLSVLLKWNQGDPVDAFEKQRNDRIYQYQGNRNPFIDHPDLASVLFRGN